MIFKKEYLQLMVQEEKVKSCTIIGRPTKELIDFYFTSNSDIRDLLDKHNIEYIMYSFSEPGEADVWTPNLGVYFPIFDKKFSTEVCSIIITNPTVNQIEQIKYLFNSIDEYYQVTVYPVYINKIVGIDKRALDFAEVLSLIPDKQNVIAEKIGKSKQLISDIKSGKSRLTLDVLKALIKEYPLLPWDNFIRG